jgi:hypothetical protein
MIRRDMMVGANRSGLTEVDSYDGGDDDAMTLSRCVGVSFLRGLLPPLPIQD